MQRWTVVFVREDYYSDTRCWWFKTVGSPWAIDVSLLLVNAAISVTPCADMWWKPASAGVLKKKNPKPGTLLSWLPTLFHSVRKHCCATYLCRFFFFFRAVALILSQVSKEFLLNVNMMRWSGLRVCCETKSDATGGVIRLCGWAQMTGKLALL